MSLQQDAFTGILKSGLLTDPLQIAALQQQLSALAVSNGGGGLSVPMPPVNVTQVPLFRTANDSSVFHMNAMLQNLPQPSVQGAVTNMEGVFAILRQIASEHRLLMVSDRERNIEEKLKDVSNPMSKRSIEHDLRVLECTNNIKNCLSINGNVLVAGPFNLDVVNRALLLVMSSVQEIEDRVKELGVKGGKVNKGGPKNGCHRCHGNHYLVDCPKTAESMTQD